VELTYSFDPSKLIDLARKMTATFIHDCSRSITESDGTIVIAKATPRGDDLGFSEIIRLTLR
jgi:hypothetical protein